MACIVTGHHGTQPGTAESVEDDDTPVPHIVTEAKAKLPRRVQESLDGLVSDLESLPRPVPDSVIDGVKFLRSMIRGLAPPAASKGGGDQREPWPSRVPDRSESPGNPAKRNVGIDQVGP